MYICICICVCICIITSIYYYYITSIITTTTTSILLLLLFTNIFSSRGFASKKKENFLINIIINIIINKDKKKFKLTISAPLFGSWVLLVWLEAK